MIDEQIASITGQIAESYARQLDEHIKRFLKKNLVPFDGDIARTNDELKTKGMRLIREDRPLSLDGDQETTYMLVKIVDSTSVVIREPRITTPKESGGKK